MTAATPAAWRLMRAGDLPAVMALAGRIHPGLPEDEAVFSERLCLFPSGCLVLDLKGEPAGYAVGHPILYPHPPSLNTLIGAIPPDADAFYIHDVAIAPEARGHRHAEEVVAALLQAASAYPQACLVSVYGTVPFWQRFGFLPADDDLAPTSLSAYGADARFMRRLTPD